MSNRDLILPTSIDPEKEIEAVQNALGRLTADVERQERLATLGLLAAGVAHEVNNLLTPVLAYSQMALAKSDDHALCVKALEKTIHGVETATHIAESILGFAGHSQEQDADIAEVVNRALECLARDPDEDRIQMRIEVQPNTRVKMNPLNLQQVVLNLILNAQAAMKGRSGRLTIAALAKGDATIAIRISDTGPGIPKEIAGRIFEPFVTTKREEPGSRSGHGLGLSICRRLIEQAGGTIPAMSKPDQGTTFLIILPSVEAKRAKAG